VRLSASLALLLAAPLAIASATEKKAELSKEKEQAVIAAYHALKPPEPQSKKIEKLPEHEEFTRINVTERVRSASFGHATWLLVPPHARHFYVEFGKSTNTPAGFFGPFDVKAAAEKADKTTTEKKEPAAPGEKTAPAGDSHSNGPPAGKTQP
jgi:hypothetical protein